jgi:outer membrane protein TolC
VENEAMRLVMKSAERALAAAVLVVTLPAWGLAQSISTSAVAQQPAAEPARPTKTLTIDEAVRLGLENNLDLLVERISPLVQDQNVRQVETAWTPNLTGLFNYNSAEDPPDSLLSGTRETVTTDTLVGNVGVAQLLPWGANYSVGWNNNRLDTNNQFYTFNPRLRSGLALSFEQPLLRNFGTDTTRTQLVIAKRNREISDEQLRSTVVNTVRSVKNAFWELAYAINNLEAQKQSLELARQTLRDNQTRVRVGTMAPIDIVEAESEVARNEEAVIVAESAITQAEDRLRALIYDMKAPDFWTATLEPTGYQGQFQLLQPVSEQEAVTSALQKRSDLIQARKQLENVDTNLKYYRNQVLPQLNFQAELNGAGVGGTELIREPGFPPGPVIGEADYGFWNVQGDVYSFKYPTWALGVTLSYPLGTSAAETSVARTKLELQQGQLQLQNLELQIATQVRDAARQVNTNVKRVDATRSSRVLAERRLEAEQKKFGVGMSTSFLVFQAQRDLTSARNAELRALVDYAKSRVDYEAIQEAALGGGGISLASGGGALATTVGTQTATAITQGQPR